MKTDYQKPDFQMEELGDLSIKQLLDQLREKDWTADLMKFASLFAANKEACPPNINAQIDEKTSVLILPSDIERFTVTVGKGSGPKWLGLGTEILIEDIGIQQLEAILLELGQARFDELKQKYST